MYSRVRQAKHTHVSRLQEVEQIRTEQRETVVTAPPEIPTAAVRRLKVMKKSVQAAQAKLNEARKQLEGAKPQWMRERQETSSMHRGVNEEFVEKVSNIQI